VKIDAGFQAGALLQHLAQFAIGRARVGGRLEHDQRAFLQVRGDGPAGFDDVGNIRLPILVERRRDANEDRIDLFDADEVGRGGETAAGPLLLDDGTVNVADVAAAGVAGVNLGGVDIKADDVDAGSCELQAEGQPDVAEANHSQTNLTHNDNNGRGGRSLDSIDRSDGTRRITPLAARKFEPESESNLEPRKFLADINHIRRFQVKRFHAFAIERVSQV
jgi:hypothetical protein